ncbi:MAG: hypothetical protein LBK50_00205 [Candidatus Nomurabacteria bacterium]|jgi:hypothetical protein|nr:hypothetical protein [Candidatus Nomurabacteria bacterium]
MAILNLIVPMRSVSIPAGARSYFLAGPISGGDDWQRLAIAHLATYDPECFVACPCRYGEDKKLQKYLVKSDGKVRFENQTHWERAFINHAAEHGCLLFWIPRESKRNPRPAKSGSYAQDTVVELGRYSERVSQRGWNMVVGAESEALPNLRTIHKNLCYDFGCNWKPEPEFPLYSSLARTVRAAIAKAKGE